MTGLITGESQSIPSAEGNESNPFGSPDGGIVISYDLPESTFVLVEEGEHLARVKSLIPGRSKEKRHPQLAIEWAIVGGEQDGLVVKDWLTLTKESLWVLTRFCEAVGLGQAGSSVSFTPEDALDRLATITVTHNEVGERTYANIANVQPPPQGAGAEYEAPTDGVPF